MTRQRTDISGMKFGRFSVIEKVYIQERKEYKWKCICDCGKEKIVYGHDLKSGHSKSCGCLSKDNASSLFKKHGLRNSNAYNVWMHMLSRCRNKKNKSYKNYGGRGIKVCKEWESFEKFHEDMGDKPQGMQLDRINNDGNYCKENCRWATPIQQSRNKRNNRFVEVDGESKTVAEWSAIAGISQALIIWRLNNGWTNAEAIKNPVGITGKPHEKRS